MNLIIAGSRSFGDYTLLRSEVLKFLNKDIWLLPTIISGTAMGADRLGEQFAKEFKLELIKMPADWANNGRSAGYIRNKEMAVIANACIVFWDGKSKGTHHMIDIAKDYKLKLKIVMI